MARYYCSYEHVANPKLTYLITYIINDLFSAMFEFHCLPLSISNKEGHDGRGVSLAVGRVVEKEGYLISLLLEDKWLVDSYFGRP